MEIEALINHYWWVIVVAGAATLATRLVVAYVLARRADREVRLIRQMGRPRRPELRIDVVIGDITTQEVDVIVNAAKSSLYGGSGVDGAIHKAGGPAILEECRKLRATRYPTGLAPGRAVATTAGNLPADWVVHTVGPVYDRADDRSTMLRSCYTESLRTAEVMGAQTVAFPLISAGVYGWPKEDAIRQALTALRSQPTTVQAVRLVLFDEETYRIAQEILKGR